MKALVVGGAGFVGSTLVDRLLAEGHRVDVVDDLSTGTLAHLADARADRSHDFTFHRLDVADPTLPDLVAHRQPEVLFHLALPSTGTPAAARVGTQRVIEAAGGARLVVAIDAHHRHAARRRRAEVPISTTSAAPPEGEWAEAVAAVLDSLDAAALDFCAVALPTVYGPRQPSDAPVARLLAAAAASGLDAESLAVAAGQAWADSTDDLLFVDDAVDALVRAAAPDTGRAVDVGSGVPTSGLDLAVAVVAATAPPSDPSGLDGWPHDPPVRVRHFALDPAEAERVLGWRPWTSVAHGIALTA